MVIRKKIKVYNPSQLTTVISKKELKSAVAVAEVPGVKVGRYNFVDLMNIILENLAGEYSETSTYMLGDICIYKGQLYLNTFDSGSTPQPPSKWDPSKWKGTTIQELMSSGVLDYLKSSSTVEFPKPSIRVNITTEDSIQTMFGKIWKYFEDLKPVAFSGDYNDLTNKPEFKTVNL